MANQVSGSELTLLEAVNAEYVPKPRLMSWNEFQVWRRDEGKRPLLAADGHTTTTPQEVVLWKSVMLDLYGPEWAVELALIETTVPSAQPSGNGDSTDPDDDFQMHQHDGQGRR